MTCCESNGFEWSLFPGDSITKHILSGKLWEPHLLEFMRLFIKPNFTCVDGGACFGWHSLEMSRLAHRGHVVAFEPHLPAMELLQKNIEKNNIKNITISRCALSNREHHAYLCNAYDENINIGDSFIREEYRSSDVVCKAGKSLPLSGSKITCTTLDKYLGNVRVNFFKLDVQGFELAALQGSINILSRYKPVIAIEIEESCLLMNGYDTKTLVDYIESLGYVIFYLESDYPCDHICVHKDNLDKFLVDFGQYEQPHLTNNSVSNNFACGITRKLVIKH